MEKWNDLQSSVTKLKGKVDDLDVSWAKVDQKLNELVELAETARLIVYLTVFIGMITMLVHNFG
jgi:uncharacterized protein (DUF3084 family)